MLRFGVNNEFRLLMFGLVPTSQVIRRIRGTGSNVFLTFDDGPTVDFTQTVLDALADEKVTASFFVVGARAAKHPAIVQRMLREGHAVFSHSTDHRFIHYFRTPFALKRWMTRSLKELEDLTGREQRIFRPPGGFVPPPLYLAARSLGVPIVLWNHRFYDWVHRWTPARAEASIVRAAGGDIVLLHDEQRKENRDQFVKTLRLYIGRLRQKDLQPAPLTNELALRQSAPKE